MESRQPKDLWSLECTGRCDINPLGFEPQAPLPESNDNQNDISIPSISFSKGPTVARITHVFPSSYETFWNSNALDVGPPYGVASLCHPTIPTTAQFQNQWQKIDDQRNQNINGHALLRFRVWRIWPTGAIPSDCLVLMHQLRFLCIPVNDILLSRIIPVKSLSVNSCQSSIIGLKLWNSLLQGHRAVLHPFVIQQSRPTLSFKTNDGK